MDQEVKICTGCGLEKELISFKKVYTKGIAYYGQRCKACINLTQKVRRNSSRYASSKKYEKTFKGHLVATYKNMRARVLGIQKKKAHLYEGLELLDRDLFYQWSTDNTDYQSLHESWTLSDYDRRLTPSIDRIDPSKGYTLDNIRWLPHWKNSQIGASGKEKRDSLLRNIV